MMEHIFEEIAGYEVEKAELYKIWSMFENRVEYEGLGAKLPKGVIFYGKPGTGKTLFATALANALNRYCAYEVFSIRAKNENSVCRQIRKAFLKAKKCKVLSVVVFDEMDKYLPNRGEEYVTDRAKTVLTQLLTYLDGMNDNSAPLFIATCNDYGALPAPLVRAGRIDKKIGLSLPAYDSRVKIIEAYKNRAACKFAMTAEEMANLCAGFSCAELATLVNECVLNEEDGVVDGQAVRRLIMEIKGEDILRKRSLLDETVRACRNIGAFFVAREFDGGSYLLTLDAQTVCNDFFNELLSYYDSGYVCGGDDEEDEEEHMRVYYDKTEIVNAVTVLFGGYVAEEVILGRVYDNAKAYLSLVNELYEELAANGMLGLNLWYSSYRQEEIPYSYERVEKLNEVLNELTKKCYDLAKTVILKKEEVIRKLIPCLIEKQILEQTECESLIRQIEEKELSN